jgi:hypothetical protein
MYQITDEHRENLRKSHLGKKPGNYGKHYTFVKRIKKKCLQCNKKFGVIPSDKNRKYCSSICFQASRLTKEEIAERKRLYDLKYNKSDTHKKACLKWCREHPERVRIAQRTAWAYKTGKIKWQPCEVCKIKINLQKHHPDYTKPLKIKWLCRKCHTELHKLIRKNS